jgi:hypothetical protein
LVEPLGTKGRSLLVFSDPLAFGRDDSPVCDDIDLAKPGVAR